MTRSLLSTEDNRFVLKHIKLVIENKLGFGCTGTIYHAKIFKDKIDDAVMTGKYLNFINYFTRLKQVSYYHYAFIL